MAKQPTQTITTKICGLTQAADAVFAANSGAQYLGLIFAPRSPRCLTRTEAESITQAVRGSFNTVSIVGVFQNQAPETVFEYATHLNLDLIQLHGEENLSEWLTISPKPLIKALPIPTADALPEILHTISVQTHQPFAWLLDFPKGSHLSWQALTPYAPALKRTTETLSAHLWLAGKLTPETVGQVIADYQPNGVDVASGVEYVSSTDTRVGQKDPKRVQSFCQAVCSQHRDHPLP